jgi:hypothetical protein
LKAAAVGDRREMTVGVRLVTMAGIGALPTPGTFKALQNTADLAESLCLIGNPNFQIYKQYKPSGTNKGK